PRLWGRPRGSAAPPLPAQLLPSYSARIHVSRKAPHRWGARTRRPGAASPVDRQPGAPPTGESTPDAGDRLEPGAPEQPCRDQAAMPARADDVDLHVTGMVPRFPVEPAQREMARPGRVASAPLAVLAYVDEDCATTLRRIRLVGG